MGKYSAFEEIDLADYLVDFRQPAHLLHPLPLRNGEHATVQVKSAGTRHFVLDPYPFTEPTLSFEFPARFVESKLFSSAGELQQRFNGSQAEMLTVTVGSN